MATNPYTQADINKQYNDWRAGNPTKTAEDAYNYGTSLGLTGSQVNQASVAYKPPVDPNRQTAVNKAFADSMAQMGITSASDPRWTDASAALTKQANELGVDNTEYSTAMGAWNDGQIAKSQQWNGGAAANSDQLKVAQDWAKGKTSDELAAKGKEMNLTPEQFASVFGRTGEEATGVGYGTSGGLIASAKGLTWNGSEWVRPAATTGGTTTGAGGSTTTTTTTGGTQTNTGGGAVASGGGGGGGGAAPAVERYQAERVATTPDMTIEGRMGRLMDPNDPRNQQLATQAKQIANGRGVMNSSMGDTMIQDSIIRNAIAIAQPDAAMTADNAKFSAAAGNMASQFNAGAQNTMGLQVQGQGYDATKTDKLVAADVEKAKTQQAYTQANMAQSQLYTQANMATQNGFDLTKMTAQEQTDLKKMGAAFGYNLQLADAGQKAEIAKMAVAQDYLRNNMGLANSFDISKMEKGAALTLAQMDAQQLNTVATLAIKQGYDVANLTSAQATQLAAAGISASAATTAAAMAADARRELQMDQNAFTTLTNGSQNALSIVSGLQNKFQQIQMDTNITDPAAKKAALTDATNIARAAMGVIAHSTNDASFNAVLDMIDL